MDLFNPFIEKNNLREIQRSGARFTWTNKQLISIQSNIDRVLCTIEWEQFFPLCTVGTLTRIGSDHWPVVLVDGDHYKVNKRIFKFENQWVKKDGFQQLIAEKWQQGGDNRKRSSYSLDKWQNKMSKLRTFLKGWGGNLKGEHKRIKEEILIQIRRLDDLEFADRLNKAQYEE